MSFSNQREAEGQRGSGDIEATCSSMIRSRGLVHRMEERIQPFSQGIPRRAEAEAPTNGKKSETRMICQHARYECNVNDSPRKKNPPTEGEHSGGWGSSLLWIDVERTSAGGIIWQERSRMLHRKGVCEYFSTSTSGDAPMEVILRPWQRHISFYSFALHATHPSVSESSKRPRVLQPSILETHLT